jgi:hypothetical protein
MPPRNRERDVCVTPVLQMHTGWHTNAEESILVQTEKDDLLTYALFLLILSVEEVQEINNI